MKQKIKAIGLCLLLLTAVLFAAGCSQEETPYQINDAENYSVSVKFDANGGFFTTNTSVIADSYDLSQLEKNSDGQAQIALIPPDSSFRDKNAFTPINNGYFLAGWYTERVDAGTDSLGNPAYTYTGLWDFEEDRVTLDPAKSYTAEEPVLTLYAAWIPMFQIELFDLDSGDLLQTISYDPTADSEILLPAWDEETGAIEMNDFPEKSGFTFQGAYYDAQGTQAVETAQIVHSGAVDYTTGTAKDPSMKLYVDWMEGEWYHIYNVEQFVDNASVSGCYEIHADLDFADEIWPSSLMHGTFTGTIRGNGHTFKNISFEQTNNSKVSCGLFGQLADTASISDVTFENVTFTIKSGTRMAGTTYGLLAGSASAKALCSNVKILTSTLQIDSGCYFGTDDYTIGLVCGMGSLDVDHSGIACTAVGDKPESVVITVNETAVTVEFITG